MMRAVLILAVILLLASQIQFSHAQIPQTISYQGFVRDSSGVPLNGTLDVSFKLYTSPDPLELPVNTERLTVTFNQGVFNVVLGEAVGFGASIFNGPLWLGITVHPADETPTGPQAPELSPRQPLTAVPYAIEAANAQLLNGVNVQALDQSAHVNATDNPHQVTAEQVGALVQADLDTALLGKADAVHDHNDLYYLKSEVDALIQGLMANNAALAARVSALEALDISTQLQSLQSQITALQNAGSGSAIDPFVRVVGTDIFIEGANLFINNGTGTQTTANALGNLIVGYNPNATTTSGSHNIVVGAENNFSSTGGLVSGFRNNVSGVNAATVGGFNNSATNSQSVSVGGVLNTASGFASVTAAGSGTQATGGSSLSAGGSDGIAEGTFSVRLGGDNSTAPGREAVAIGGRNNTANAPFSVVAGGENNSINSSDPNNSNNLEGALSTIVGGKDNQINSLRALIAGGEGNVIDKDVTGTRGEVASILGGKGNRTAGNFSVITGGENNEIEASSVSSIVGRFTALFGGAGNTANGGRDVTLLGGKNNTAGISSALVLGGEGLVGGQPNEVVLPAIDASDPRIDTLFSGVSRDGDTLIFSGMNLQLDNGLGQTDSVNGLGNLTIGYNEQRAGGSVIFNDRSGSHNLLLGQRHNYSGYSSMIQGINNTSSSNNSLLLGAESSSVTADFGAVLGGFQNQSGAQSAVVLGGQSNVAMGHRSVALGGQNNSATGIGAVVNGGLSNSATGEHSVASGGQGNAANGDRSVTTGGLNNQANRTNSTVRGGRNVQTGN